MPNLSKKSKVSNQADTPLLSQKKHRDKARWVATEATIIMTLLLQKATGNSLESGFKPAVWSLVVDVVGEATTESVRNLLQYKTCYHRVCAHNSIYWNVATEFLQLKVEYKDVWTLCGCLGSAGMKESRW